MQQAAQVVQLAEQKGLTLVTAESCTGGLVAAVLSEAPGAASHLHGGFVTYTKEQKAAVLNVPARLLQAKGAVCAEVAEAMVAGALERCPADVAVSVTGVAGPSRDEDGNPVGLVHLAAMRRGAAPVAAQHTFGPIGRGAIRYRTVAAALGLLTKALAPEPDQITRDGSPATTAEK